MKLKLRGTREVNGLSKLGVLCELLADRFDLERYMSLDILDPEDTSLVSLYDGDPVEIDLDYDIAGYLVGFLPDTWSKTGATWSVESDIATVTPEGHLVVQGNPGPNPIIIKVTLTEVSGNTYEICLVSGGTYRFGNTQPDSIKAILARYGYLLGPTESLRFQKDPESMKIWLQETEEPEGPVTLTLGDTEVLAFDDGSAIAI